MGCSPYLMGKNDLIFNNFFVCFTIKHTNPYNILILKDIENCAYT